jgi:hypothetical protein
MKQFLARGLGGIRQSSRSFGCRIGKPCLDRFTQRRLIRREASGDVMAKGQPVCWRQRVQGLHQFARQSSAGGFATATEQSFGQSAHPLGRRQRPRGDIREVTTSVGYRTPKTFQPIGREVGAGYGLHGQWRLTSNGQPD